MMLERGGVGLLEWRESVDADKEVSWSTSSCLPMAAVAHEPFRCPSCSPWRLDDAAHMHDVCMLR